MVLEQITKQYSPWFHRAVTTFSLLKKTLKDTSIFFLVLAVSNSELAILVLA